MLTVTLPEKMNAAFATAFNARSLEGLMALYETQAQLRTSDADQTQIGHQAIRASLTRLLEAPGTMTSRNNFCMAFEDIALLRADWHLEHEGDIIASGSSAEIVRRQDDGRWLYIVDHAVGASSPRVA